jgi:pimeloyl-[acyl-carrier protein] methyl ester esterase
MNQIKYISGWGTDSCVWNPVLRGKSPNPQISKSPNSSIMSNSRCDPVLFDPVLFKSPNLQIPKSPNNIVHWWECLSNEVSNNTLYKLLSESDSPCILVGWSLGGMIALSAAITFPEKVSGLVIVSSSARMVQDEEYVGVNPRVLKAMKFRLKTDKQGLLNDFAVMGISPGKNNSIRNDFVNKALEIDNNKLSEGLAYLQNSDLRDRIPIIKVPVNIIHGECDEIMNFANARYLGDNLLNAYLEIVGDAGHFLLHSNPNIIVESIKNLQRKVC